jgi:membrane protein DedA with SNARE-associated domain
MNTFGRILKPALIVWAIAFSVGYFGPIYWAPEANQGPLLGIFVTGPIGFFVGLAWGIYREWRRRAQQQNTPRR